MQDKTNNRSGESERAEDVGQLIRFAGVREQVDMDRFEKAHGRVAQHWQGVVEKRRRERRHRQRRRLLTRLAAVAGITFVAVTTYWAMVMTDIDGGAPFATVSAIVGKVRLDDELLEVGRELHVSTVLTTGRGERVVLDLESGHELKLDQNSTFVARKQHGIRLVAGAVFVRSTPGVESRPLQVETRFGTASDLGTQFIVRLDRESLKIAVREGLVHLVNDVAEKFDIADGKLLTLSRNGDVDTRPVQADDAIWDWADSMPPAFEIDGVTLSSYLEWYAAEIGARLEWADDESEASADRIVLSGSIAGATLGEGLEEVRRIAPFDMEVTDDTIRVSVH